MIEKFEHITNNFQESIDLGIIFSKFLNKGDVVGLNGDLGTGKTTFVKGVLFGLGYEYDVSSPTFTLINEYETPFKVIHADFQRDNNPERWKNIGFEETVFNSDIVLIEWSNLFPSLLPPNIHILMFEHIDLNKRKIFLK